MSTAAIGEPMAGMARCSGADIARRGDWGTTRRTIPIGIGHGAGIGLDAGLGTTRGGRRGSARPTSTTRGIVLTITAGAITPAGTTTTASTNAKRHRVRAEQPRHTVTLRRRQTEWPPRQHTLRQRQSHIAAGRL